MSFCPVLWPFNFSKYAGEQTKGTLIPQAPGGINCQCKWGLLATLPFKGGLFKSKLLSH